MVGELVGVVVAVVFVVDVFVLAVFVVVDVHIPVAVFVLHSIIFSS